MVGAASGSHFSTSQLWLITVVHSLVCCQFQVRNPSDPDKIYPPRLVLKYAEVDIKNLDANTAYSKYTEFGISYRMELSEGSFKESFYHFLIVNSILAAALAGLRIYRFTKADQGSFNCLVVVDILGILSRAVGHTFGLNYLLFALYWYALFKMQGEVTTLMPANDDISWELYWYWGVGFTSVFLGTVHVIVGQMTADIFFIDWESAQGRVLSSNRTTSQVPNPNPNPNYVAGA